MGLARSIKKNAAITRLRHYGLYLAILGACRIVRLLPWAWIVRLGHLGGRFIFHVVRYGRRRAIENLTRVFGETRSRREILAIARRAYENLAITALEFPVMARLNDEEFFAKTDYTQADADLLFSCLEGCGAIYASAHLGNWEMVANWGTRIGYPMSVLYKPASNPYLTRLWCALRGTTRLIDIDENLSTVIRRLRRNEAIALLFDENARRRGIPVEFLGRPASTYKGPAFFSLATGCPILCAYFVRREDGRHTFIVERIVRPDLDAADREAEMLRILRELNASLEAIIRRYPDQWNWIYKRWS